MTSSKNLLEARGLTKRFPRGTGDFCAVDRVDFALCEGDFGHIVGRSGSGKSTLVNLLSGLLTPFSGETFFDGAPLPYGDDAAMARLRNERIGYVPQDSRLLPHLTVWDNVRLPLYLDGPSPDGGAPKKDRADGERRARELLDRMGIAALGGAFPRELSGGEARRAMLARALLKGPSLLIADEPTADLDVLTSHEVMEEIRRVHSEGTTVLMITHELELLSYGTRIWTMEDGRLAEGQNLVVPKGRS